MPSKTCKQAKLMAAAAHNKKIAKKRGIPQKVAKEYNKADKKSGKLKRCYESELKFVAKGSGVITECLKVISKKTGIAEKDLVAFELDANQYEIYQLV